MEILPDTNQKVVDWSHTATNFSRLAPSQSCNISKMLVRGSVPTKLAALCEGNDTSDLFAPCDIQFLASCGKDWGKNEVRRCGIQNTPHCLFMKVEDVDSVA